MKPVGVKTFRVRGKLYVVMYDKYQEGLAQYWVETPENALGYPDYIYMYQLENKKGFSVRAFFQRHKASVMRKCLSVLKEMYELA